MKNKSKKYKTKGPINAQAISACGNFFAISNNNVISLYKKGKHIRN